MIKLQNLSKVYRTDEVETVALDNINVDIDAGEFVAVRGTVSGRTSPAFRFGGSLVRWRLSLRSPGISGCCSGGAAARAAAWVPCSARGAVFCHSGGDESLGVAVDDSPRDERLDRLDALAELLADVGGRVAGPRLAETRREPWLRILCAFASR